MLEIKDLTVSVGKFCLKEVNLVVRDGVKHVIVGPTGSGKTLLLETILGIQQPYKGAILLNGTNITKYPSHERNITYVPQDVCLFPHLTVRENIEYGCIVKYNKIPQKYKDHIQSVIELLKLENLLDRYPARLSGGERQRVSIARALAVMPTLIVLDEPFSAIDFSFREDLRREVKYLFETLKTTALIVTHDLDEAFFLADRLSILIEGELIQTGTREEIFYFPKTVRAAKFLGIKNIFEGVVKSLNNNIITIVSDEFGYEFKIPCKCAQKRFNIDEKVYFGFRPEFITFFEKPPQFFSETEQNQNIIYKDSIYYIKAKIFNFYIRGSKHTAVVEYSSKQNSNKVIIELDLLDRTVAYKLENSSEYFIGISDRNIFLLKY